MTNKQLLVLGGFIVLAGLVHGLIVRAPEAHLVMPAQADSSRRDLSAEVERIRQESAETQSLIQHTRPTTLSVGDRTLIVRSDWKQTNGNIKVTETYYEYRDGQLVVVPEVELAKPGK